MAAVRASSPDHLFGDATYDSIRQDLLSFLNVLHPLLPKKDFASIFEDWTRLCNLFKQVAPHIQPIHEKITAWNPEQDETQKIKALWMQIFSAFQHPEVDSRERAIATFAIFFEYVAGPSGADSSELLEESDCKQNDLEPSAICAASAEDQSPSVSAVIFDDADYISIRQSSRELIDQLKDKLKTPTILEDWHKLCSLFEELDMASIQNKVAAWNPEHAETLKVKALWEQIFTALRHPDIDSREHVITTFFVLAFRVIEHDIIEEISRPFSPIPADVTAPPTSPIGFEPNSSTAETD